MKRRTCWRAALLLALTAIGGCALPERPSESRLYDLGPGPASAPAVPTVGPGLQVQVRAMPALDGLAMHYRLAYADEAQLHAYGRARWAMPPADLLRQRVLETLGAQQLVLGPGEGATRLLRLELEEFAQVFEAPQRSLARLRLRATLAEITPTGTRTLGQRSWLLRQPAASADATGGVHALTQATEALALELAQWLKTFP